MATSTGFKPNTYWPQRGRSEIGEECAANLEFARAQTADADEVQAILEEARQWLLSKGIKQWSHPFTKNWLDKRIEEHEVYLVSVNGLTIGTVTIQWSDEETWGEMPDDGGYIHRMAIRREFRGQGLGLELLRWAERRIATQHKRFARLDCWAESPKLSAYYETAGYVFQRVAAAKYGPVSLYQKEL